MSITNEELAKDIRALDEKVTALQAHILSKSDNVELKKNSKGYTWEIKVYDGNDAALLDRLRRIDDSLTHEYGGRL